MKNKLHLIFILLIFSIISVSAQSNYFYYYKGQKVYLTLDKNFLNVFTNENFQKPSIADLNFKDFDLVNNNATNQLQKFAKIEFQTEPTDLEFLQKINSLKQNDNINQVSLYFKRTNAPSIGISNIFYIKLKNVNDYNILQDIANQKDVQIVKQVPYMPEWYILSLRKTTIGNTLDLTNYFYETGLIADVDPAFMFDFKFGSVNNNSTARISANNTNPVISNPTATCNTNDPIFPQQWALNNNSNQNIDINACQAWGISQGEGVKVAVIDSGIDLQHLDLEGNIFNPSNPGFNAETGAPPSLFSDVGFSSDLGTNVAGIIAAKRNNNLQTVGVAPLSKIIPISFIRDDYDTTTISAKLASSISWAYQNGADVINNSWGTPTDPSIYSELLNSAITNAITLGRDNKGAIVLFSAGDSAYSWEAMDYPAILFDDAIVVSSIHQDGHRSIWGGLGRASGYGPKLDVVAPGNDIITLSMNNWATTNGGTVIACPHVSGICALILSVNPCLTGKQVRDIIEKTSNKVGGYNYTITANRPNGTWNNEMGYGLVDAYAAVQMASQMYSATLDLMVKDGTTDIGGEPNNINTNMWESSDIWLRNQPDGIQNQFHENPDYHMNNFLVYAYVRITNKSCVASAANNIVRLNWAKAGTSLIWPETWDGYHYFPAPNNTKKLGGYLGGATIPALNPGEEKIVQIQVYLPSPYDYTFFPGSEQWHFCLLARIETTPPSLDPVTYYSSMNDFVRKNNNVAQKNISMIDSNIYDKTNGVIAVGNPFNEPRTFFLELEKEDLETGKAIFEEAEVSLKMDETLYAAWERGGKEAQLLDPTLDEKRKIVRGNNVILDNLSFNPNEIGSLNLSFNFLTKELTDKSEFVYRVIQKDALTGEVIGGETYIIKKQPRPDFIADAGGTKDVNKNEPITISASQISEPAIYNWYDSEGHLISVGKDLTIATEIATKYKLEVIATADGFKDYTEVDVRLKPSTLDVIAPNPATDNVVIGYKLNEVGSAYLMIIGCYGTTGASNNYILDINSTETNIDLSTYANGFYTVALVCNGQIVDAKNLIKN